MNFHNKSITSRKTKFTSRVVELPRYFISKESNRNVVYNGFFFFPELFLYRTYHFFLRLRGILFKASIAVVVVGIL